MTQINSHKAAVPSLTLARFFTGISMLFERFWPLFLPVLIVSATFASLSWFGVFRSIPDFVRYAFAGVLGLSFLISLWRLRKLRIPTGQEINARLELSNDLAHQPIAVQNDVLAGTPDEFSQALWQIHQHRMAQKLSTVTAAGPRPKIYELDTWALRTLPALTIVIAFAFSMGSLGGRLSDIWHGKAALPSIPPRIDAWVTPPRYTGKAPLFLSALANDAATITVPENSSLTVRIGGQVAQAYQLTVNGKPFAPANIKPDTDALPSDGQQFTTVLKENAAVELVFESDTVWQSKFQIIKDTPPVINFASDPSTARNGTLNLSYAIKDDYGSTKASAKFKLNPITKNARSLYEMPDLPLVLPRRNTKEATAKTSKDLTSHPLAGEEFTITLHAQDGADQAAQSTAKTFVLPQYFLTNQLARALAEDRRLLARDASAKSLVLLLLDALTIRPETTLNDASHFLGIETARIRLYQAKSDDELREVVDYLWQIALTIDKNALSDAQARLAQAQEKLEQALENGASDEEINELMKELRQAMNEFMKELAQQERKTPNSQQSEQKTQELSSNDLEKMLDKLEELSKQGAKEQAKELLNQLRDMMNNLQAQRGNQDGEGGEGQSQMEGKLNELGKMLREQQKLLDETFKQDQQGQSGDGQEQNDQGAGEQGQGQNGQGGQQGGKENGSQGGLGGLEQRQNNLGEQLQGLMNGLKELGLDPGKELGKAGEAMGRAGKNLGQGKSGEALGDQAQALDALRKGAEGLMNQMQQAFGNQGGGQQRGKTGPSDRDPLGRSRSENSEDTGLSTKVPDEIDVQRAREIMEAIRKRLGNALSPELEKQYLERLLQFD